MPDIRLIVYYYYAYFTNLGIKALIEVLPGLMTILNNHWDVLRPFNRKEKQVENSLNWLFLHVLNKLKYCERQFKEGKIHPIWHKSTLETTPDEMNQLIERIKEFKDFFFDKWPKSPTRDRLLHLQKKIDEMKPLIIIEPSEEKEETQTEELSEPEQVTTETKDKEKISEEIIDKVEEILSEPSGEEQLITNVHESVIENQESLQKPKEAVSKETIFSADELEAFSNKLKIFESLIAKNDYLKAAVVAKDIEHLIQNFDPLSYFPKLFSTYYFLFAKHVAALSEQFNNKESLQVKCLEKLYRIDPEKFLEW